MAKTVYDVLIDRMEEQIASASEFLCDGRAKNEAEYREMCGLIRGLKIAQREIQDLSRIQMEDDDD